MDAIPKIKETKKQVVKENHHLGDTMSKKLGTIKGSRFEMLNKLFKGDFNSKVGNNNGRDKEVTTLVNMG